MMGRLVGYRLRWFALSTARLLLRRWQAVVLIVCLSASANSSALGNLETLAHPLLALLAPGHGAFWRGAYMVGLLTACGWWAGMQRAQIEGGPFMAFVGALPFAPRQLRRVHLAVLLLADSPLLLLLAGALLSTVAHHAPWAHLLLLGVLALLALVVQVAVLERRLDHLLAALAVGFGAACGFELRAAPAILLLLAVGAAIALWCGPWRHAQRRTGGGSAPAPRLATMPSMRHMVAARWQAQHRGAWWPPLQLSLRMLLRERRNEATGKGLLACAVLAAAWGLGQLFEGDARSLGAILIAEGLVALTIGGMFRYLHMTHRASGDYTGALPLAPNWWRPFDLAVVAVFCLPFLAGLAAMAWWLGAATPAQGMLTLLSSMLLLGALSVPHLYTERHAVVAGTVITGAWIAAMFACLI